MIFSFCCFSLGCSRICIATRWRKPFDSLAWFGFFWYLKVRGRGEGGRKAAATRLPSCRLAVSSALLVVRPLSPSPFQCCQIRCSLLTKQKHVAFSAFVLCLCYALLCAVASLFSSCLCFSCVSHFRGTHF